MECGNRCGHGHPVVRHSIICFVVALLSPGFLWGHPVPGTPAPSLSSLRLLQAPPGVSANRASLRGKVVVLEFWATWCSPCIASLPRINQLVTSLDPAKFQFISIDDEDFQAVENFLSKKKMSGWVGVDESGAVFRQYGIQSRPTTVVIDANGKLIAVTEIDSLTKADLSAVAEGKRVTFKPILAITETTAPSKPAIAGSLFAVSVSKASPEEKLSFAKHPPTGTDLLGQDADSLLTNVLDTFNNRYVLKDSLPQGRFDLHVNTVAVPVEVSDTIIQQAVLAALHVRIQPKTITRAAYILRATAASKELLSPSASTHAVKRGCWHGRFLLMNGSMDDLAYILATGLEMPVVNETGINGTYDARFEVNEADVDSLNTVLKNTYGLELVAGSQESSLTVLEVTKQTENQRSPPEEVQPNKH